MDERKRKLKGSEKRDTFKQLHKELDGGFYACDADFCLISKKPPGTVAYLDYKGLGDNVTFAEAIQYNGWMQEAPVYIVIADDPVTGPFTVKRYLGADWRPEPPIVTFGEEFICGSWRSFGIWERMLREEYTRRNGWSGSLKGAIDAVGKT